MSATIRSVSVAGLALPGLIHGFEQRLGPAGWETREATRMRVASALGSANRLLLMKQVHGRTVIHAPWDQRPEADASVADRPAFLLGVETADCLPILVADPRRRLVAAVHAGWRGTAAGVGEAAIDALRGLGAQPADLVAALGPCIGACCYEVGDDVRAAFSSWGGEFFRPGPRGRAHFDLRGANAQILVACGLAAERIHNLSDCTFCRADLYHSYRRDGAGAGRMISYVGFVSP